MASIRVIKEDPKMTSTIFESSTSPFLITEWLDFTEGRDFYH